MRKAAPNVLLVMGAIIAIADTIMDVTATATFAGQSSFTWWLLAGVATAAVTFIQFIAAKVMQGRASIAAPEGAESLIDPSIICRWDAVWDEFEIDPDEPRAEITQFPSVLAQIEQAEEARKGCSIRAVRVALGERVMVLMREALGPLAAELDYLKSEEGRIRATTLNTLTQQRQHEQDVVAELLASSPI